MGLLVAHRADVTLQHRAGTPLFGFLLLLDARQPNGKRRRAKCQTLLLLGGSIGAPLAELGDLVPLGQIDRIRALIQLAQ